MYLNKTHFSQKSTKRSIIRSAVQLLNKIQKINSTTDSKSYRKYY